MNDDLVKRLRVITGFILFETRDRIAASACISEEAAARIEELEVKLAEAVGALEWFASPAFVSVGEPRDCIQRGIYKANDTLARLEAYTKDSIQENSKGFDEYGHYGENNGPVGNPMSSPSDKDYEV